MKAFWKAKPKTKSKKVRFNLYFPEAERVSLVGDFNNWNILSLPMKKFRDGFWETSIDLPPGRYEYRFCVNGIRQGEPNTQEMVENPFGTQTWVRVVI